MNFGLPQGMRTILARLGIGGAGLQPAGPEKAGKGPSDAHDPAESDAVDQGSAFLGYDPVDRTKAAHNLAERAAVTRFLQDPKDISRTPQKESPRHEEGATPAQTNRRSGPAEDKATETQRNPTEEPKTGPEERERFLRAHREEPVRDGRRESPKEQPEARERGKERERQGDPDRGEQEGHGEVFNFELSELLIEPTPTGSAAAEVFDDGFRCQGLEPNRARCLRKPLEGTRYCRIHTAGA